MTTQEEYFDNQICALEIELEQAQERIRQLQTDLADMTTLAVDYKEANTRLEAEMRELLAKDDGRTREHNLLVQENRKLKKALDELWDYVRDNGMNSSFTG